MNKNALKYIGLFLAIGVLLALWYGVGWILQRPNHLTNPNKDSLRIISMAPSATEILFAIGAANQVVAVSSFTEWPEEAKSRPALGGHLDASLEAIIALKPDVVVTNGHLPGVGGAAQGFRIEEVAFESFGDIERAIIRLGALTGHEDQAKKLKDKLNHELESVRRWASLRGKGSTPRVLLVIGRDPGALRHVYGASGASFLIHALEAAGAQDAIQSKNSWPMLSIEQIVQSDPDIILELAPGQGLSLAEVRAIWWGALPTLRAVRDDKVYLLTENELLIPGPRLSWVARRMAEVVHGEAFGGSF